MFSRRPVLAAIVLAAFHSVGDARSEPPASATASMSAHSGAAVPAAERYYRMGSPERSNAEDDGLRVTAMTRPEVLPGTTAWLARGAGAEPLAASYALPHAGRQEVGFSYSSDGRMNAYVAERGRDASHPEPAAAASGCCARDGTLVAPGTYEARGGETRAVTSLLAQLKRRGLKLALDDAWKISAGARSREYSNAFLNTRVGHITVQRLWGSFITAYSFQLEKRGGWNVAPSQSLQLGYAFAPRSTVALAYTTGQELAFFGQRGVLKTEVRSLALQAEHALEKDWSLRLDAGHYDHGELPSHRVVRLAFQRRLW
jgi:hypothetical protein